MAKMTYGEVIELAIELGFMESYKFIKMGRGKALNGEFLRIKLKQHGKVPELSIFWEDIERRVGKRRMFSHNPSAPTTTVTLYED